MARKIEDRLTRLQSRRFDESLPEIAKMTEQYEKRTNNQATKYTLGAMQEVDPRSTRISLEEAEKVERNLKDVLPSKMLFPVYHLQGSVPINIHTRSVSDVDLLVIEGSYLRREYCENSRITYAPYTGRGTLVEDVLFLRNSTVNALNQRFWGATVDSSPAKSIQLSEGGFRRKVDVVPAHWLDTTQYQTSLDKTKRGIEIVDQYERTSFANFPFLYRERIESKDILTAGGAKMSIRLAKNIRNDAEHEIELTSYDIGSLIFHCPNDYIFAQTTRDMIILSGVQKWFNELASDREFTSSLDTPDGTRKIIDNSVLWNGLLQLNNEITALAMEVAGEIVRPYIRSDFDLNELHRTLNDEKISLVSDEIKRSA